MLEAGTTTQLLSELPGTSQAAGTKWFSEIGCVVKDGDNGQVFVGGTLVGRFEVGDTAARNVLLINLAFDRRQHLGRLARAFEIGESTLGEIRRRYAQGGLDEIARVYKPGGKKPKLGARQQGCGELPRALGGRAKPRQTVRPVGPPRDAVLVDDLGQLPPATRLLLDDRANVIGAD